MGSSGCGFQPLFPPDELGFPTIYSDPTKHVMWKLAFIKDMHNFKCQLVALVDVVF